MEKYNMQILIKAEMAILILDKVTSQQRISPETEAHYVMINKC